MGGVVRAVLPPLGAIVGFALGGPIGAAIGGTLGGLAAGIGVRQAEQVSAVDSGVFLNVTGSDQPLPVIYGTIRTGGLQVFGPRLTNGDQTLHLVLVWCEGEIESISEYQFNNVDYLNSRFSGLYEFHDHFGTDAQAADANLVSRVTEWTTDHKLSGCAYTYIQLLGNKEVWRSGVPTISVKIEGRRVYDVRDQTVKFSNNPALCIYDYVTNDRFGLGMTAAQIDTQSFIDAANHCDELVSIPDGAGGSTTQERYTCDGILDTSIRPPENVRQLLSSCNGRFVQRGDVWSLLIDQVETSVFSLTEDHIVGEWRIMPPQFADKFNRVTAHIVDPDQDWKPNQAIADSPTFRTADKEVLLEQEIALPFTRNYYRAQQMAGILLKQSRSRMRVSFKATLAAYNAAPFELIDITHSTPGWTNQPFRILKMSQAIEGEVSIEGVFYDANDYNLETLATKPVPALTQLPDPFADQVAPSITALDSSEAQIYQLTDATLISRVKLDYAITNLFQQDGTLEIEYKESAAGTWLPAGNKRRPGATGFVFIENVADGVLHDFRIRTISTLGLVSAWATEIDHPVIGKSSDPDDVTGFTVTSKTDGTVEFAWNLVSNIDVLVGGGYEIRFQSGATFDWGTAVAIKPGLHTLADYEHDLEVPDGAYSFGIKAIDSTQHESLNAATVLNVQHYHPVNVDTPTGLTLTSGNTTYELRDDGHVAARILVEWTDPVHPAAEGIGVQLKKGADAWQQIGVVELGEQRLFIEGVVVGDSYQVRIRSRAVRANFSSYVTSAPHVVAGKTTPPPNPNSLLVNTLSGGVREYRWTMPSLPKDLDGYRLRYKAGTGHAWGALDGLLADEGTGLIKQSPYESTQLAGGTYTFGVAAVDTSGNESATPFIVEATLGEPPIGGALAQEDILRQAWPGQLVSCFVDPKNLLVGNAGAGNTWLAAGTWAAMGAWIFDSVASYQYTHEDGVGNALIDLGFDAYFTPLTSITTFNANATITYNYKTAAGAWSGWVTVTGPITARYIRIRIAVAVPDTGQISYISQCLFVAAADAIEETISDLDTSTLGAPVGDFRLPINETFQVITKIDVNFQNVGGGWSWEVIDKDPVLGPRIKTYNATPTLADATIDALVRGL